VRFFTKTELRARGWSARLIEELLGDPDYSKRNPYRRGSPILRWQEERVINAEKAEPFLHHQEHREKRSLAAQNGRRELRPK
jgi:hypothetical protein